MTFAAIDATAPRSAWLAALARKDRAIVGPIADFVLMYGSPVLALALVGAFMVLPGAQTDVGYGATTTGLAFIVAAITFAHLAPVFVRSHLNPQIFSAHRLKLTIVPPLLLLALGVRRRGRHLGVLGRLPHRTAEFRPRPHL